MSDQKGSRQTRWAREKRAWMMAVLGGKCVRCALTTNLTFDCIRPTGDRHHRMSSVQRVTYYMRQMRAGNLQVLCHACNSAKGATHQDAYRLTVSPDGVARLVSLPLRTHTDTQSSHTYTAP